MPQISRFFGIVIAMYHDDHQPAHFHARYAGNEIQVGIADGRVIGEFPNRARALVLEWWSLHRDELERNWLLVANGQEPMWIEPLR
jgi:phosphomannomutase